MPFHLVPQRDRKLNRLVQEGPVRAYARGEEIYGAGADADALYLVRRGHVALRLPPGAPDGGRIVAVAGPRELFGTEALEASATRLLGARAGEETEVVVLPGSRTLRAIRTTTHTLPLLVRAAGRDLARARWSGPGAAGPSTSARLADLLLELSRRMGRPSEAAGKGTRTIRIPHWFTHQELADLVGGHRSTVTTLLNDWIYEGVLEDDDHALVVLRPGALEARGSGREGWISGR